MAILPGPCLLLICAIFVAPVGFGQTYHKIQIANDQDDGYYNGDDGSGWHYVPQTGGADLVGSESSMATAWVIGYRFESTGINSGDTIRSAYLVVTSSDGHSTSNACGAAPCPATTSTFRVYGVAQDDGPAFSGTAGDTPLDVPYTSHSVDYVSTGPGDDPGSCGENNGGAKANYGQNTCTHIIDVTNIVQEITSRPGFTNASAIRFVLISTTTTPNPVYKGFEDYNANASESATLIVNPPLPTIVSSGGYGTDSNTSYPLSYAEGPFVYPGANTLLFYLGDYFTFFNQAIPQPTISDSCGNTWNILAGPTQWQGQIYSMRSTVYYVQNPVQCTAGDTITVSLSVQEPIFTHFLAVANSDTTQTPIVSAITSPPSPNYTTSATAGPVTLLNPGLLVSWIFGDSDLAHTFTPQSGFNTDVNSTLNYLTLTDENVASAGTYSDQYSITAPSNPQDNADGWQTILIGLATPASGAPVISSSGTQSAVTGRAFSYQILASNSPSSYAATGLPSGVTVDTSSGLISGSPSSAGTYTDNLSATNGFGTGTATLTLTVANPGNPTITWAAPAAISYGTSLSTTQLNATASVQGTFAYSPALGTVLGAGTQSLSVTFTPTDTTDYNTATDSVQLVVNKATPSIAWTTPAAINYGTPLSGTQLDATALPVQGAYVYNPVAGTVLTAGTQTLSVAFTPNDTTDYASAMETVQLVVNKEPLTITWPAPASIAYGTALSATQLNATTTVPGTFSYSPVLGTVLAVGTQTLSATFTPTDTTDYAVTNQTVQLVVNKAPSTITWPAPASIAYGTALSATQLNATTTVPGTFSYSPVLGTVLAVGTQNLSATFTPTDTTDYTVTNQTVPLVVNKANTTTALQPSSATVNAGSSVTLTAQVASTTIGTPTGTVTFFDGSTQLGSGALNGGSATFATSTLAPGQAHQLSAVYSGDADFLASSTPTSVAVVVGASSFAFALSDSTKGTVSVAQGGIASYSLLAAPAANQNYPGTVTFAATGLPTGATVSFSPTTIAPSAGQQLVSVNIQTAAAASASAARPGIVRLASASLALLILPLLGAGRLRRQGQRLHRMLVLLFVLASILGSTALIGCGGQVTPGSGSGTGTGTGGGGTGTGTGTGSTPTSYTVTLTASAGGVQESQQVTLTIQ